VARAVVVAVGAAAFAACGTEPASPYAVQTYAFGPFMIAPAQEVSDQCVQITLNNDQPLYINQVELTTGPGFHHSNWFFVPAGDPKSGALPTYPGPDGTFTCADRAFDQATAALRGGVLFAQSTQSPHDVQSFPVGVALKIPAHSKLVAQIHLLNASESALTLHPTIALTPMREASVITTLAAMSFENHALGLPPQSQSAFVQDCDLAPEWTILQGQGQVTTATPNFSIYYALAHYHTMGTELTIEAVKPDGTATTVFSTTNHVGDALGSTIDPPFSMADGYTRLRYTCSYYNNTDAQVNWGIGNQEMCVFLAFSDSTFDWGGGEPTDSAPGSGQNVNGVMTFSHPCQVFASDATH